jgi:RimJ/RimL family protein N-acetyltransferase
MEIRTERLLMREFLADDWQAMAAWWSDPRYQTYYEEHDDIDGVVRDLVGRFVANQQSSPRRNWQLAIVEPASGALIGNCGIRVNDPVLREANIGYELTPDVWGRGYATEAASAILRFGFEELGLHRIWAECVGDNRRSARVLEKLGMRREAQFREHQFYRDRWWDTLIYAILESEWRGG